MTRSFFERRLLARRRGFPPWGREGLTYLGWEVEQMMAAHPERVLYRGPGPTWVEMSAMLEGLEVRR